MRKIIFLGFVTTILLMCSFLNTCFADKNDGLFESLWSSPEYTPPDIHPKVFFDADKLSDIRENIDAEENKFAKNMLDNYVEKTISYTTGQNVTYSETTLANIESKAFYYVVYKDVIGYEEKALKAGEDAVKSIPAIINMSILTSSNIDSGITTPQDPQRRYGRIMNVLSEIYDWCYPLIKDDNELTSEIIARCINCTQNMEIWNNNTYSPSSLSAFAGHGPEKENMRDLLSFAIAFSKERPDVWNAVGGRFYECYVPAREFHFQSGYLHAGTDYGICREYGTICAYALITGMGAPEPWSGEDMARLGYSDLYTRRPDGQHIYDGDIYTNTTPPFDYTANSQYNTMFMYASVASENEAPYFKSEYFRQALSYTDGVVSLNCFESSPVLYIILNNTNVKAKSYFELPHSRYFPLPGGVMVARTGWEDGINSDSVVAEFKVNEYYYSDHQHLDSGHFGIYYKGLLATDGGNYGTYGDKEHNMYTRKSVAHNTLLVYDPDEGNFEDFSFSNINDGGQRAISPKFTSVDTFKSTGKLSEVLAHEIDPRNTQKPYYSYMKGDLANAYTDKVTEFERSFMFLDLKNEETPAAVIVFDKVKSSNPKFKKTWLLHGIEKPEINTQTQTTIFKNTGEYSGGSYNGQLALKTLLPTSANFDVVGGPENNIASNTDLADNNDKYGDWGIVQGWKYNEEVSTWIKTSELDYGDFSIDSQSEDNERNTYRLEVSPCEANNEDYFLNVMIVGEADKSIDIKSVLLDDNPEFYGTQVIDRLVFFSRDGKKKESFNYANITSNTTLRYTICDMKSGTYKVVCGGREQYVCVSDEGGVLSFECDGSEVSAVWVNAEYTSPDDEVYKTINDVVYVSNGKNFSKSGIISYESDMAIKVNLKSFTDAMGYSVFESEKNGQIIVNIYDGVNKVAVIKEGVSGVYTSSGYYTCKNPPETDSNGVLLMLFSDINNILSFKGEYLEFANTFYLYNANKINNIYATANITSDNILNVNAKIENAHECKFFVAVKNDDVLMSVANLEDKGEGCFSASIDISEIPIEKCEIVLYTWGNMLYPLASAKVAESIDDVSYFCTLDGINQLKIERRHQLVYNELTQTTENSSSSPWQQNYEKNGAKLLLTRPEGYGLHYETSFAFYDNYVKTITDGIVHYSTTLKGNYFSNDSEKLVTVVRGSGGSTNTFRYQHATYPGVEYKIDCIVNLDQNMLYIYEDGSLVMSSECNCTNINSFEGYIRNYDYLIDNGESQYELFDSTIRVYPSGTDIETVVDTIGEFIILK